MLGKATMLRVNGDSVMDRRKFVATAACGMIFVPGATEAQQSRPVPRVGWLAPNAAKGSEPNLEAYRQAMRALGYAEGRTVNTEYRFADGRVERLPDLAAELVNLRVDVIVTTGTPASLAAKRATQSIPVVFAVSSDPVGGGVVASLAHPGGNVTGLSLMASDLSAKRLELLHEPPVPI